MNILYPMSQSLFYILLLASSVCGQPQLAYAESLPETVKRHDDQIKVLGDQLKALKDSLDTSSGDRSSAAANAKQPPRGCKKDFAKIAAATYSKFGLESVIDINKSGIIIKHIRSVVAPPNLPNYVIVASNVDVLNNRPLESGKTFPFSFEGCKYSLTIERVAPTDAIETLKVFLNYDE